MEINLSWDLLVIVFFTVIIAYTFIIGRNQSLKIIISAYIAILAADGIGNLAERYLLGEQPAIRAFDFSSDEGMLILTKIIIFILCIILITTRGKFQINMSHSNSIMMRAILALTYGVLSAGLITSTILIYASGASLVQENSIIMKRNRSFQFDGVVDAGLFRFTGHNFFFQYDSFKIALQDIDSLQLSIPSGRRNEYGEQILTRIDNAIENMTGELLIDHPDNKSGLEQFPEYPTFTSRENSFIF